MATTTKPFRGINEATNEQYCSFVGVKTATIVKGGTRSDAVLLDGLSPVRLCFPAGWRTTSAIVKVSVSENGSTYYPLWKATGTAYTIPAVKSRAYQLSPDDFRGVTYIKLSSTTAKGTAVTQGTICPISVVARLI